jgi:hypothetical protein
MQEYSLIFSYGIQMTIVFLVGLGLYTVSVLRTKAEMVLWYQINGLRIAICLILFWLIGSGMVVVPNFAQILGAFGFNADQSTAGIALVIVGLVIKGKGDTTKLKLELSTPADTAAEEAATDAAKEK